MNCCPMKRPFLLRKNSPSIHRDGEPFGEGRRGAKALPRFGGPLLPLLPAKPFVLPLFEGGERGAILWEGMEAIPFLIFL